jgi:dipeptidase E
MSTIILTSSGFKTPIISEEIFKVLSKKSTETKVAHIITASKVSLDQSYVDKDRQALQKAGFQVEDIDIRGKTKKDLEKLLLDKDIIYVQGGNGFYLLKYIRKSGFEDIVRALIKKGVIYIGVSAGSYVACPNLEMHTWKKKLRNRNEIVNLGAMNLVPFLITAHYSRTDAEDKERIQRGIKKSKYPVYLLNDDQALLVKDEVVKLIGAK